MPARERMCSGVCIARAPGGSRAASGEGLCSTTASQLGRGPVGSASARGACSRGVGRASALRRVVRTGRRGVFAVASAVSAVEALCMSVCMLTCR